jgi:hypothetical protein
MSGRAIASLGRQSAIAEARALYRMAACGTESVEGICGLIAVPVRIEQALRAFARAHPEEAHFVDRALMFRQAVMAEFNRLVSVGATPAYVVGSQRNGVGPV